MEHSAQGKRSDTLGPPCWSSRALKGQKHYNVYRSYRTAIIANILTSASCYKHLRINLSHPQNTPMGERRVSRGIFSAASFTYCSTPCSPVCAGQSPWCYAPVCSRAQTLCSPGRAVALRACSQAHYSACRTVRP